MNSTILPVGQTLKFQHHLIPLFPSHSMQSLLVNSVSPVSKHIPTVATSHQVHSLRVLPKQMKPSSHGSWLTCGPYKSIFLTEIAVTYRPSLHGTSAHGPRPAGLALSGNAASPKAHPQRSHSPFCQSLKNWIVCVIRASLSTHLVYHHHCQDLEHDWYTNNKCSIRV